MPVILVFGSIFGLIMVGLAQGWFTANEAGGIGAGRTFLFALARGKLSTMIFVVAAGAMVLNQFLNFSGITGNTVEFIQSPGLTPWQVTDCLLLFYILPGCLMDGLAMLFLPVPIIAQVVDSPGCDPVWWDIVTAMVVDVSLITPLVGPNVFILRAMLPEVPIVQVFWGMMAH